MISRYLFNEPNGYESNHALVTGNIGYHHIHHLNSRIPFYRLKEAMDSMPELKNVPTTSWNPIEMFRCLRLKLWDAENNRMITLTSKITISSHNDCIDPLQSKDSLQPELRLPAIIFRSDQEFVDKCLSVIILLFSASQSLRRRHRNISMDSTKWWEHSLTRAYCPWLL